MRRISLALLLSFAASFAACRPAGLPPEPPDRDPTNPDAPIPAYRAAASPFETSAFPTDAPEAPDEHDDHHHHRLPRGDDQKPVEPADGSPAHDHGGNP